MANRITSIVINEDNDVLFRLQDSDDIWDANEFDYYTKTGTTLRAIQALIWLFHNHFPYNDDTTPS